MVGLGFALLSGAQHGKVVTSMMVPLVLYMAAAFVTSLILARLLPNADQLIFPIVTLLGGVGLIEITRLDHAIGSSLGGKQLLWLIVGDVVLIATAVWPRNISWLRLYKYTWAIIGFGLIALDHCPRRGHRGHRVPALDRLPRSVPATGRVPQDLHGDLLCRLS